MLEGTIGPEKPVRSYHLIMVVWLTNAQFVVDRVYKNINGRSHAGFSWGLPSHPSQPFSIVKAATHSWFIGWISFVCVCVLPFFSLCDIINMAAFCFVEVRETMLLRSPSTTCTTSNQTTTRTPLIIMVTTVTWRAPSCTADARGALVRPTEYNVLNLEVASWLLFTPYSLHHTLAHKITV